MRTPMTPKQAKVLRWLVRWFSLNQDTGPSYAEIAKGCGLASDGAAARYLDQLEKRGRITRMAGVRRSIRLIEV